MRDILRIGVASSVVERVDQHRHRHRDRPGRADRSGRGRGLRHRRAAGVSAGPAGVRPRRAGGGDGRHQHRRRPPRARAARGVDRRGDRLRPHRGDRACGGVLPGGVAVVVRQRSEDDRGRDAAICSIVGPVYGFFGGGLALYFASQGAGRVGWAGDDRGVARRHRGGRRLDRGDRSSAAATGCSPRLPWRSWSTASPMSRRWPAAPGSRRRRLKAPLPAAQPS